MDDLVQNVGCHEVFPLEGRSTPAETIAVVAPVSKDRIPADAVRPTLPAASPTQDLDHAVRAGIARLTGGLAPTALASAFFDWAVHLAASPGKELELAGHAITAAVENAVVAARFAHRVATDP